MVFFGIDVFIDGFVFDEVVWLCDCFV